MEKRFQINDLEMFWRSFLARIGGNLAKTPFFVAGARQVSEGESKSPMKSTP